MWNPCLRRPPGDWKPLLVMSRRCSKTSWMWPEVAFCHFGEAVLRGSGLLNGPWPADNPGQPYGGSILHSPPPPHGVWTANLQIATDKQPLRHCSPMDSSTPRLWYPLTVEGINKSSADTEGPLYNVRKIRHSFIGKLFLSFFKLPFDYYILMLYTLSWSKPYWTQ